MADVEHIARNRPTIWATDVPLMLSGALACALTGSWFGCGFSLYLAVRAYLMQEPAQ